MLFGGICSRIGIVRRSDASWSGEGETNTKVREVLTPLVMEALTRLCRSRELRVSGTKDEVLRRLAHSYRGNLSALVCDLRRQELLRIASWYSDDIEFPASLGALRVSELREACLAVFEERYVATDGEVGRATDDGGNDEHPSEEPDGGDFHIELHATANGGVPGVRHVDENSLAGMAKNADSVTVLSAYYIRDVLKNIAGACRGDVRMILNGLGGRRLNEQAENLERLQATLRERSRSTEIRLAFAKGVFHAKMYVFQTGADAVAWIGSANATKAGLKGRNEEVLVRVSPVPRSVSAYVESAWSRSLPVECCPGAVNSLTAFFRTGMLYYKPYATLQMTVNPFRKSIETLPTEEKRKISRFQSAFAEPDAGIGAFSLKRMFDGGEGESATPPVERHRVELRRFAVETCYGYWVAEPLITGVDAMLYKASAAKHRWLEHFREWMATSPDAIVGEYASYLRDARRTLDEQGVKWPESEARVFEDTSPIEGRVDSLLEMFRTERHHQAFVQSEVPEIWEDDVACASFVDSFFDSLSRVWSARRRDGSAKLILDSLAPLPESVWLSPDPAREIRTALECALRQESWYENKFRQR